MLDLTFIDKTWILYPKVVPISKAKLELAAINDSALIAVGTQNQRNGIASHASDAVYA